MATLQSIVSNVWGISTVGYGVIAEGIALLRQRIAMVLTTSKGSDPLRPEFGSNIFRYVGAPVNVAIPNIRKEIVQSLAMWMPEIKVNYVRVTSNFDHNPLFQIGYNVIDDELSDTISYSPTSGVSGSPETPITELLLQAYFPPNPYGHRYQIKFILNGEEKQPSPNPGGYDTLNELFEWVRANWFFYGRPFFLSDRIVLYINGEGVTDASLSISVLVSSTMLEAAFPELGVDQFYQLVFQQGGVDVEPLMPTTFSAIGEVLQFVQDNYGQFGNWLLETYLSESDSVFDEIFSDEFIGLVQGYSLVLVSPDGFVGTLNLNAIDG
jgi:phage baseplate assembly protein W